MNFLAGPALNSRNYQRRVCNRPSVCVKHNKMVSGGHRTHAAEDWSGKAVHGNKALLSAVVASNKKSRLDVNKNPCIPSLKDIQRSVCCTESCSRSLTDGKATC